jgi:taurine dioxygenase
MVGIEDSIGQASVSRNGIRLERVTTNIGGIVHDLDVSSRYGSDVAATLNGWLHEHGVLFFYCGKAISDDDFRALASYFGTPYDYEYTRNKSRSADGIIAQIGFDESVPRSRHTERTPASYWHTDGSSQAAPPQAALLTPIRLPSLGGDTMWASTTAAFEGLSSHYQRMLEGLEAVHATAAQRRHFSSQDDHKAIFGQGESCVHPVVVRDAVSNKKALYVNSNFTDRIVGMKAEESARLLDLLFEHINTPEFHVRLRWQPHTVAVWEERVTQHRAVADYTEPRTLRRITIAGDAPAA